MRIYLSGQISGLTFEGANDWRERVSDVFNDAGFQVLNPLRGKSFLSHQGPIIKHDVVQNPTLADKALYRRDKLDVTTSDVVLCNLMEPDRVSIGSMYELAWAEDHNKLVVVAMPEGSLHEHAFVRESAVIFRSLDQAVDYILSCGLDKS